MSNYATPGAINTKGLSDFPLSALADNGSTLTVNNGILEFSTSLTNALSLKAPLASPVLTGTTSIETLKLGLETDISIGTSFGWRDITMDVSVKGQGAKNPSWTTIRDGLSGYEFSASSMKECWISIHINHDYAPGTPIYAHVHWCNSGTSSGNVVWGFEYSVAKGHQQEVFPTTTTVYATQASAGQYYHNISEISPGISSSSIEPDSLILIRVFRDASNVLDTCTDPVHLLCVDAHYQASRFATKNKSPNFYS